MTFKLLTPICKEDSLRDFVYGKDPAENTKSITIFQNFENSAVFLQKISPMLTSESWK